MSSGGERGSQYQSASSGGERGESIPVREFWGRKGGVNTSQRVLGQKRGESITLYSLLITNSREDNKLFVNVTQVFNAYKN